MTTKEINEKLDEFEQGVSRKATIFIVIASLAVTVVWAYCIIRLVVKFTS